MTIKTNFVGKTGPNRWTEALPSIVGGVSVSVYEVILNACESIEFYADSDKEALEYYLTSSYAFDAPLTVLYKNRSTWLARNKDHAKAILETYE